MLLLPACDSDEPKWAHIEEAGTLSTALLSSCIAVWTFLFGLDAEERPLELVQAVPSPLGHLALADPIDVTGQPCRISPRT